MKRIAIVGLVFCLFVLAGAWTANGRGAAGPDVTKAGDNQVLAAVKPICSIKDKCMFRRQLCVARCRCLNNPSLCLKLCVDKYRKCLRSIHTMDCWDAAWQAKLRAKYLRDCPKMPGR